MSTVEDCRPVVRWSDFNDEAPDLAAVVRARFDAATHHVLATLRRDGTPRLSGTEVIFTRDDLFVGSMYGARKAHDMQRDARVALHTNPGDGSMGLGDAKVGGRALEVTGPAEIRAVLGEDHPPDAAHLFRIEPTEVVLTAVDAPREVLVIQLWRPGEDVVNFERV